VAAEAPDESATAAAAPAADKQTAMVLPPKLTAGELRLLFGSGATTLSEAAKGRLAALAEQLRAEPQRRIQVQAFAGGTEISARDARRVSLSRAVAVRDFLIEQGLSGRRIDVRALGSDSGSGPAHRVDVLDARG
jgi:outer membrane protein OmpA-like peptidoglycan-associated protein